MVQPQSPSGSVLQSEMTGEEAVGAVGQGSLGIGSPGSLRVPPELAENQVVHRLLEDNHQLREALRHSNVALKERCEEMEGWRQRSGEEREFLGQRFREARDLVERLARENRELLAQLDHKGVQTPDMQTPGQSTDQQPDIACAQGDQLMSPLETPDKREGEKAREAETDASPQSLPSEGGNEILRLLRSHREKLEEGMRDLRKRNEELEEELQKEEREKEGLRAVNAELQSKLSQLQGDTVMEEALLCSEAPASSSHSLPGPALSAAPSSQLAQLSKQLQATQIRYRELQEKLDGLQKTRVQQDAIESMLKQREEDCAQLAKDAEMLKAQVTSLLGELHERQCSLGKSEADRVRLQEKLRETQEALQCLERESEQLKTQHSVTVDKLRLQTHNLETALKTERLALTEDKRKLAQLQHAYTQLFQDYDAKLKSEIQAKQRGGEVEELANRLVEAERALALKQDLIDKLKEEVEQQRGTLETVPVLTAQAEIYKADFLAEREAREKLHQRKEELQEQLNLALAEVDRLKKEGTSRARMEEMQQRHLEDYRTGRPHLPPLAGGFPGATVPFSPAQPSYRRRSVSEELPDYRCPKCQYQAPDMDTLQIHVTDCIQ